MAFTTGPMRVPVLWARRAAILSPLWLPFVSAASGPLQKASMLPESVVLWLVLGACWVLIASLSLVVPFKLVKALCRKP